jgi:hypothetical protein
MCCMSGCTLMITSGLYFMIPATTSLKCKQIINNNNGHNLVVHCQC